MPGRIRRGPDRGRARDRGLVLDHRGRWHGRRVAERRPVRILRLVTVVAVHVLKLPEAKSFNCAVVCCDVRVSAWKRVKQGTAVLREAEDLRQVDPHLEELVRLQRVRPYSTVPTASGTTSCSPDRTPGRPDGRRVAEVPAELELERFRGLRRVRVPHVDLHQRVVAPTREVAQDQDVADVVRTDEGRGRPVGELQATRPWNSQKPMNALPLFARRSAAA